MNKKGKSKEFDINLGLRIKVFRTKQKIRQRQVADAIGVSIQQYGKYEIGVNRFPIESVVKISQFLNVPLLILLNLQDDELQTNMSEAGEC